MGEEWWTRLDLHIPAVVLPEDLVTVEACVHCVRKLCRDVAELEKQHEAWRQRPEVVGNEVALWQAGKAMNQLRDHVADVISEVAHRLATLEATRPNA
jgi:hypothetical protein